MARKTYKSGASRWCARGVSESPKGSKVSPRPDRSKNLPMPGARSSSLLKYEYHLRNKGITQVVTLVFPGLSLDFKGSGYRYEGSIFNIGHLTAVPPILYHRGSLAISVYISSFDQMKHVLREGEECGGAPRAVLKSQMMKPFLRLVLKPILHSETWQR